MAEVEKQRTRAQALAVEGLLNADELRAKLSRPRRDSRCHQA
jgi:hypothetical protein